VVTLPKRATYLRFEVPSAGKTDGVLNGIFAAAYELRDAPELAAWKADQLELMISWFRKNLRRPRRFTSSKSKGYRQRSARGMSWFKDTAQEHLSRIREMKHFLAEEGVVVLERTTERPGYIVYEDDVQIVAEPFRDN
jgi:hypothetical protein